MTGREDSASNLALIARTVLAVVAALAFNYPRTVAFRLACSAAWIAAAIFYRGVLLAGRDKHRSSGRDNVRAHHI